MAGAIPSGVQIDPAAQHTQQKEAGIQPQPKDAETGAPALLAYPEAPIGQKG